MASAPGHGSRKRFRTSMRVQTYGKAQSRIQESHAYYQAIFEAGPFPKVLYDPVTFAILAVNDAAVELYGYRRDEFLAVTLKDLRPPEEIPKLVAAFAHPLPDRYHAGIWIHRKKDGALIEVDVYTHAMVLSGRTVRLAELHDVTEWKHAEAALAKRTQQLEAVRAITAEIAQELDIANVLRLVVQRACELTGAAAADIDLWDHERQLLVPEASYGHAAPYPATTRRLGEGAMGTVAQTLQGLILNDYRSSPVAHPDTLAHTTITASIVEPLLYRGTLLGVIGVDHETPGRTFATQDRDLLRLFADQAAIAIENARLFQAEQGRRKELDAVRAGSEEITRELDLAALLRLIHERALELVQGDSGSVWLWDESAQVLLPRSWPGFGEWMADVRLRPGEGVTGTAAARRQGMIVNDFRTSPYAYPLFVERMKHVAVLAEPLLYRERLVGVLSVNRNDPARPFTVEDQRLVRLFASQAAIAIVNARLYQEGEIRQQQFATLVHVTQGLTRGLDLTTVMAAITEAAATLFQGDAGFRLLEGDYLVRKFVTPRAREMMHRERLRLGESLSGQVAVSGEAIVTADALTDPRLIPEHRAGTLAAGTGALMCVPIRVEGRILGTLHIFRERGYVFDKTAVALASSLADQAGIAIENARLFAELNESYAKLQQAQAELVRSEKLRGLGQMAAGIAHDLNNTLAAILGQVELLKLRGAPPEVREGLDILEAAATDGAHVVRRLQDFARQRTASPLAPMDLGQAVQETLEITRPRWQDEVQQRGKTIAVQAALDDLPPMLGNAPEVREALTNLIFNAVDAMPDGGTLTFAGTAAPGWITLQMTDTGIGMPEGVRQKVFEPFFTTKGVKGTGLGLSVVYGIMERHGGRADVTSVPGQGTTFTLRFQQAPAGPSGRAPAPQSVARASRCILVIDDEAVVRRTMTELLRAAGHTVLAAESGPAGLAQLEHTLPDLVLTDLGMPEMSGAEVARRVKAAHPRLPVILLTGWGDTTMLPKADRQSVDRVLGKPVRLADLLQVVAELTESGHLGERIAPV
jgi:PAS domain S-box-containing protein